MKIEYRNKILMAIVICSLLIVNLFSCHENPWVIELTDPLFSCDKVGHKWGAWKATTPASCLLDGEQTRICTKDETHIETQTISALGHSMGEWIGTATCTTAGNSTRVCTRTGCSHNETVSGTALDHLMQWTKTQNATCMTAEKQNGVCTRPGCTHTDTRDFGSLNPTAHGSFTSGYCEHGCGTPATYTVTFNGNGGTPATTTATANYGTTVTPFPANPTMANHYFKGWNTLQNGSGSPFTSATTVTGNITVFAQWQAKTITVSTEQDFEDAINAIASGDDDADYTIIVNGEVSVDGTTSPNFAPRTGITVTVKGNGKLKLKSNGSLFRLGTGQKLVIDDEDLILEGKTGNTHALLQVETGGNIELKNGMITSNINSTNYNANQAGGGVCVSGGTFTMSGGIISNNHATGGEVGGTGNVNGSGQGGGVFLNGGIFNMTAGTISSNTANGSGGGVCVYEGATFNMSGGFIEKNTARRGGGGVIINFSSIFNMSGGNIYGNDDTINQNNATGNTGGHALLVDNPGGTAKYGDGTNIGGTGIPRQINTTIVGKP